jgi:HSP20 family molecular chaperone IbpA
MVIKPETINYKIMFGHTRGTAFDKAIENIFNNIGEPWKNEILFGNGNPFNDTCLEDNTLSIALPGFSKKDIKIDIDGDLLIVSSKVEEADETKFKKSFKRSFRLIKNVNVNTIKASMENGILYIAFERKNVAKEIKIS